MPPTPTHTSRTGDIRPRDLMALMAGQLPNPPWNVMRLGVAEIDHLAALLDGVLADDPVAIRDAAAWLAANRPEVDG